MTSREETEHFRGCGQEKVAKIVHCGSTFLPVRFHMFRSTSRVLRSDALPCGSSEAAAFNRSVIQSFLTYSWGLQVGLDNTLYRWNLRLSELAAQPRKGNTP